MIPLVALAGFTVDDALISARIAHHIALGVGLRFNLDGPVVDAVTPLGWAHLLSIFPHGSTLAAFSSARVLGALSWIATGILLGRSISKIAGRPDWFLLLVVVAGSAPLGAWAGSGMETAVVTLIATLGAFRFRAAPLFAGLAAAWRPELLPWAMVLAVGTTLTKTRRPLPALGALGLAMAPALVVAIARQLAFGSPMPLAVLAKPSTLGDGARYALGALLFTAIPFCVIARPRVLDGHSRSLLAAALAHFVAVVMAGGDWMPLYRLVVPILPSLVLVGAQVFARTSLTTNLVRLVPALGASAVLWIGLGASSRGVWRARLAVIDESRPLLAGASRVATLDAGWVGAAFPGHVVDVAGVTDPRIAALPGGHTEKQLPSDFFEREGIDVAIVLFDESRGDYFRLNDARMARRAEELGFVRVGELALRGSPYRYFVLKRPR